MHINNRICPCSYAISFKISNMSQKSRMDFMPIIAFLVLLIGIVMSASGGMAGTFLIGLSLLMIIADLTASASRKKGRSYWAFFFLSLILPIITWLVIATMAPIDQQLSIDKASSEPSRTCPFCAEDIKLAAIVCKHCGKDIPSA